MHTGYQVHANKVNFPEEFSCENGENLIRQVTHFGKFRNQL